MIAKRGGGRRSPRPGVFTGFILGRDGAAVAMRVVVWPVGGGKGRGRGAGNGKPKKGADSDGVSGHGEKRASTLLLSLQSLPPGRS